MSTPDPNGPQYQGQPGPQQPVPQPQQAGQPMPNAQQTAPNYQYAAGTNVPPLGQNAGQTTGQTPQQLYTEPPQDQPWYGISFVDAIKRFFTKYADFSGRASRGEYWWAVLLSVLVSFAIGFISGATHGFGNLLNTVWNLATIVPSIAVGVRRLHDTNRSGWWLALPYGLRAVGIIFAAIGGITASSVSSSRSYESYSSASGQMIWAILLAGIFILAGDICEIVMMISASNPAGVQFDKRPVAGYAAYAYGAGTPTNASAAAGQPYTSAQQMPTTYQQQGANGNRYYGQAQQQTQQAAQPLQYQQPQQYQQPSQQTAQPGQMPQQPQDYGQNQPR